MDGAAFEAYLQQALLVTVPQPEQAQAADLANVYRTIAEDALKKAGYSVAPEARYHVSISLKGNTSNGVIDSNAALLRNFVVGMLTLHIGCTRYDHVVDANATVTFGIDSNAVKTTNEHFNREDSACFQMLDPQWLANQQEASLRNYEQAVIEHVSHWLLTLNGLVNQPEPKT